MNNVTILVEIVIAVDLFKNRVIIIRQVEVLDEDSQVVRSYWGVLVLLCRDLVYCVVKDVVVMVEGNELGNEVILYVLIQNQDNLHFEVLKKTTYKEPFLTFKVKAEEN